MRIAPGLRSQIDFRSLGDFGSLPLGIIAGCPLRLGNDMETIKDIAQIIFYISLSISGPLAVIEYLKAKRIDRQAREYETYNELDNRFFEYQRLALEYYDLDILDVPNNDPSLAFDKKRKQEMVAYAILFSLFERAYLMFRQQANP